MLARHMVWGTLLLAFFSGTAAAASGCQMVRTPDIQVTMHGLSPWVSVKINGTVEQLILDSGAVSSALSVQTVQQLNLPRYSVSNTIFMEGMTGGRMAPQVAAADSFTIANLQVQHVEFVVMPVVWDNGVAGLLGLNVLRFADVEYDLADGVVRLIRPIDCGDGPLAYWATSQPVAVVDLQHASALHPHMIGPVLLNGASVRALFDSGTLHSIVSLHAAKLAGVTPQSPGVTPAGNISGLGGMPIKVWSAPFSSIDIGGEKIMFTHVLIGAINDANDDMILGADFFLAHRIYADNSRNRLYFTYNGGPVFNLNTPPAGSKASETPAAATAPATAAASTNQPTDGPGFMRRAMAYAARDEIADALADLTRACQLSPDDPQMFYQRALIYRQTGQSAKALADLDHAVALNPRDLDTRAARAALRLPERSAVEPDLAAIDHLAQPESKIRLSAAYDYGAVGDYAAEVHEYDTWIDAHKQDENSFVSDRDRALAYSNRCWAQAAGRLDLDRALRDCNQALDLLPKSPDALENRGLVHLQRGELESAVADYDQSLKLDPRNAEGLYGRGLAEMRQGKADAARTDFAAATAIEADIAKRFASFGLKP